MSCCPGKMPSARTMAKELANTAFNVFRMAAKTGQLVAADDLIKRRMDICSACLSKTGVRCMECGCYLSLKTGVAAATCPIKKW